MAEAAAAADPRPVHCWVVSVVMIDSHWVAVVLSSAARLLQPAAAAMSGPEPAPVYMSAEVMSGGIAAKSKTIFLYPVSFTEFRFLLTTCDRVGTRSLDGRRFGHDEGLD